MKIAVAGLDFPLGKKNLSDERLDKLKQMFHSKAVTSIQIEFLDKVQIKISDGILCAAGEKLDLVLSDLEIVENRLQTDTANKGVLLHAKEALEKEIILNEVPFNEEEKKVLLNINLVTLKPITLINKDNPIPIPEIIRNVYNNCAMISFFTVNEKELRSWPINKGATVYEAAGTIHSDIQRGFIKAEVASYGDLIKSGGLNQARAKGLVRLEDKGYIVKDGDLIQIRFSR